MASLNKKGIFGVQSSIVNRLGGSTAIKSNTSKAQNFPGGGIGARSSAVRRAISSKCQPSVSCTENPATTTNPIEVASAAARTASIASEAASQALAEADMLYEIILGQIASAASSVSSAETAAYNAVNAQTTAERYAYFTETSQNAAEVSAIYNAVQASVDSIADYSSIITTNAAIAHDNYLRAKALQDSL